MRSRTELKIGSFLVIDLGGRQLGLKVQTEGGTLDGLRSFLKRHVYVAFR